MNRPAATFVRWLGRLLLVAAPFVIASGILWPRGIQVLNPIVCPARTHLDNRAAGPSGGPGSVELVCRGNGIVDNATLKIVVAAAVLLAASAGAYLVANRLANPRVGKPGTQHGR